MTPREVLCDLGQGNAGKAEDARDVGDGAVQDDVAVTGGVREKQQSRRKVMVGTVKKSSAAIASRWFLKNASQFLAASPSRGNRRAR